MAAALALGDQVLLGHVLVVQLLHRQGVAEEPGARDAIGDPEVDGTVDRELDDVVRREPQALLLLLGD